MKAFIRLYFALALILLATVIVLGAPLVVSFMAGALIGNATVALVISEMEVL